MKLRIKVKDIEIEYKYFGQALEHENILLHLTKFLYELQKKK